MMLPKLALLVLLSLATTLAFDEPDPSDDALELGNDPEWEDHYNKIVKLTGAVAKYHEGVITIVRTVKDLETKTPALLDAVAAGSTSVHAVAGASGKPNGTELLAFNALKNFLAQTIPRMLRTANTNAYSLSAWVPSEQWDREVRDPTNRIMSVLRIEFDPEIDATTRGQGLKLLSNACTLSDPPASLEFVWNRVSEGCGRDDVAGNATKLRSSSASAEDRTARDQCLPEDLLDGKRYTTDAAAQIVEFLTEVTANLAFSLSACLDTDTFNAARLAHLARFRNTANDILHYMTSKMIDLVTRYFPKEVEKAIVKTMYDATDLDRKDKLTSVVSQLDDTYRDFRHSAFAFRTDETVVHVGEDSNPWLPPCAGTNYTRSTYTTGRPKVFDRWGYIVHRLPSDPTCLDDVSKKSATWKYELERSQGKNIQQLWTELLGECPTFCRGNGKLNELLGTIKNEWKFIESGYAGVHITCQKARGLNHLEWPQTSFESYTIPCYAFQYTLYFLM